VVPFATYGVASSLGWVDLPADSSPRAFLVGVLVTKLGTAVALVLILAFSGSAWTGRWWLYALIWFVMFGASEVGEAISGRSSWPEAGLGLASEAIYAPVSVVVAYRILGVG